jgi:hypothetical protein
VSKKLAAERTATTLTQQLGHHPRPISRVFTCCEEGCKMEFAHTNLLTEHRRAMHHPRPSTSSASSDTTAHRDVRQRTGEQGGEQGGGRNGSDMEEGEEEEEGGEMHASMEYSEQEVSSFRDESAGDTVGGAGGDVIMASPAGQL